MDERFGFDQSCVNRGVCLCMSCDDVGGEWLGVWALDTGLEGWGGVMSV